MFRNQQHPSERTLEFRRRMRSRRPRTPHLALNIVHRYVGVSRQAVSARVRAGKLALVDPNSFRTYRWKKVAVRDLDTWIQRREAHLPANACGRRRPARPRTAPKRRPRKTP